MGIEAVIALLTRFIPDAAQREKAIEAAREANEKFLLYTQGPLYAVYRVILMAAAAYDVILNGAAYGIRTARAAGMDPAVMVLIEVALMLWPFGQKVFDAVPGAIAQQFARVLAGRQDRGLPSVREAPEEGDRR